MPLVGMKFSNANYNSSIFLYIATWKRNYHRIAIKILKKRTKKTIRKGYIYCWGQFDCSLWPVQFFFENMFVWLLLVSSGHMAAQWGRGFYELHVPCGRGCCSHSIEEGNSQHSAASAPLPLPLPHQGCAKKTTNKEKTSCAHLLCSWLRRSVGEAPRQLWASPRVPQPAPCCGCSCRKSLWKEFPGTPFLL